MPANENEYNANRIKRIVQTGDNTYYADTKPAKKKEEKKKFAEPDKLTEKEMNEEVEEIIAEGGTVEETTEKLARLMGKNQKKKSEITDIRSTTGHNPNAAVDLEKYSEKTPLVMELEKTLINFLTRKKDIENLVQGGARKIRGLSISMDVKESSIKDYFTVEMGVCEAQFAVETGLKEKGSLFGLERHIRDWATLTSINEMLKEAVNEKRHEILRRNKKLFRRK